ncbi:uncharacterized protein M6D78_016445 isoform 1-T1 [Vipera latastei]
MIYIKPEEARKGEGRGGKAGSGEIGLAARVHTTRVSIERFSSCAKQNKSASFANSVRILLPNGAVGRPLKPTTTTITSPAANKSRFSHWTPSGGEFPRPVDPRNSNQPSPASRKNEVAAIRIRFPYKLPVILERYAKEKILPALNKVKFLVPQDFTMGQFVAIIRNRMGLRSTQAFYFLVDGNHSLVNMSAAMTEVYTAYKDEDGFLYMTYASQEMFG